MHSTFVDCGHSMEKHISSYSTPLSVQNFHCHLVLIFCFRHFPRDAWHVYIWADYVTITFLRCRYHSWIARDNSLRYIMSRCVTLCHVALHYVALRYVDEFIDLLSILTRMTDGQSLEISPNKWHSLCTPPVCRNTIPNDLKNKTENENKPNAFL